MISPPSLKADRATFEQALALTRAGRVGEALDLVAQILRLAPKDVNFLSLGGTLAMMVGTPQRAIPWLRQALKQRPDWPEAQFNLAQSLTATAAYAEATRILEKLANGLAPKAAYWEALGKAHHLAENLPQAIRAYRQLVAMAPTNKEARTTLRLLQRHVCDWSETEPVDPDGAPPAAGIVLCEDPHRLRTLTESWARQKFGGVHPMPPRRSIAHDRLRVGYISSDFHAHATSYLMAELFALHDRSRFEIFCYSYGVEDKSEIRQRIKSGVEHFADIAGLTLAEAAQHIRDDEIDILVDLKGYTRGGKLEILAYRPAPVQMHWLGYPGTLGADFVDYFIGDVIVTPPEHDGYFREKILRLPHCYQINDRQRSVGPAPGRAACGLPEQGVILASFNQTYKITPEIFTLWCAILRDLPDAVLWLYQSNGWAPDNLRAFAQRQGVDPMRLIFARPAPLAAHLARYHLVDIALDSFPVGGHTTTSDALWVGAPVVTMIGPSFVARVAASLLHAVGLPELVTETKEAYTNTVLDLAQHPEKRQNIRLHLTVHRQNLPLFDTKNFVKSWENTLQGVAKAGTV